MTEKQMPTSEVLNLAADLIESRGWTTGPAGYPDYGVKSPLCMEGGILAALGSTIRDQGDAIEACPAYRAVRSHLDIVGPVYRWNDAAGRTAEQVIATLRAVAVIEAAREQQPAEVSR